MVSRHSETIDERLTISFDEEFLFRKTTSHTVGTHSEWKHDESRRQTTAPRPPGSRGFVLATAWVAGQRLAAE